MTSRGRRWAVAYLAVVGAVVLFVVATFTVIAEPDSGANMSGVWLFFVTMPWSLVLLAGSGPGRTLPFFVLVLGLVVCAGFNAVLCGWAGDRSATRR